MRHKHTEPLIIKLPTTVRRFILNFINCSIIMLFDSSTHWNLDVYRELQLPHPDHQDDGHTDVVFGVRLQGDRLVSISADHTARIWDLRTQRSLQPPLIGHTGSVTAVQFDAATHYDIIVTGDTDGNVIVWRFSTGEVVKFIAEAHHETVLSLHFDQRYLVTGGRDGKIKLWNRQSLDVDNTDVPKFAIRPAGGDRYQEYSFLATFDGHHAAVNTLELGDKVLVSGSGDSTICIWSIRTGEILHRVNNHSGVACLQYNGRFVVSGLTDNSARIYDVAQEVEVACLRGHTNVIRSVQAVFNDCAEVKTIISGSYDGSVRVWEQVPGSQEWRTHHQFDFSGFQAHEDVHSHDEEHRFGNRVFSVDLDANRFVCSGQGPMIRVWDLCSPSE
jgi:WD40 repeat protein